MTSGASSTAVDSSEIAVRLDRVVKESLAKFDPDRLNRLREVKSRADDLARRGLLRRGEYQAASSADMERLYLRRG